MAAFTARKKPIEVCVCKWTGINRREIVDFIGDDMFFTAEGVLKIHTMEGDMQADIGDYIIRGVANEFYPCKPDIFEDTYEIKSV